MLRAVRVQNCARHSSTSAPTLEEPKKKKNNPSGWSETPEYVFNKTTQTTTHTATHVVESLLSKCDLYVCIFQLRCDFEDFDFCFVLNSVF